MSYQKVLVTGASGFIGECVVNLLSQMGYNVIAGIHCSVVPESFLTLDNVELIKLNILDQNSLMKSMIGVESVYHFAAIVDSHKPFEQLKKVNVEGTYNVWNCAVKSGVKSALYCSTAAVYGLLNDSVQPIREESTPRAIESYGYTKRMAEDIVINLAQRFNLPTVIIRPVAVFGAKEHTPFGKKLRDAAISRILLAGAFRKKSFNYIHVEDVAGAAIHLMQNNNDKVQIFNIACYEPVLFEKAFHIYINALNRAGDKFLKIKKLALMSAIINKCHPLSDSLLKYSVSRYVFDLWHPGFDMIYSSEKLKKTSYKLKKESFDEVLESCITQ